MSDKNDDNSKIVVVKEKQDKDANVEKLQIQIGTKENRYTLYGDIAFSHLIDAINTNGFASLLHFNKSSGNFQFSLQQNIESDTYDINDLGYLQNNNEQKRSAKLMM